MISEENKKEIILKMDQKKIKKKYQKYILQYIDLNEELFTFIDIDLLCKRIVENFTGVKFNLSSFLYNDFGQYIPTTGEVSLAPSLFFGKNRKYKFTVFLHELDHCACSPTQLKRQYDKYKSDIKIKYKFWNIFIPEIVLTENFLKIYYEGPITGIANLERKKGYISQKLLYGTKLENHLNEGITSLKQKIYSEKLKIPFHKKRDFFYGGRIGAECIGKVIGFDNMIYQHFNNNFKNIKEDFFKKTNMELEELILKCIEYDQKKSKKRLRKLENFIRQVYKEANYE